MNDSPSRIKIKTIQRTFQRVQGHNIVTANGLLLQACQTILRRSQIIVQQQLQFIQQHA